MNRILLSQLESQQTARIVNIADNGSMKRRFMELGLVHNSRIRCTMAPGRGIKGYCICGSVMGIRDRDAMRVEVEVTGDEE